MADLRTRLCRSAHGADALTLLEFEYAGPPEYAGIQQIVTTRRGVLAIAAAVPMLLDPAANPGHDAAVVDLAAATFVNRGDEVRHGRVLRP